jgi:hypothetical protein
MLVRGARHRDAIRAVLDAFGEESKHFVFVGGCVLGLYARPQGAPLRVTNDVDCISTRTPWVLQAKVLADLCTRGVLVPDPELSCRFRIKGTGVDVDVLSPQGLNVGGVNPFFERATARARAYDLGDGRKVNAVTPAYFLATKLAAFEDRGPDALSSKDLEDIVALAVEVADLSEQVRAEGITAEVADWWVRALSKYGATAGDLADIVDGHLAREDTSHRTRVLVALWSLLPNDAVYCACIHGEPGAQTFGATRGEPVASRLAFKFEGPAFDRDVDLNGYFAANFLPLHVVFDDATGQEHPSQGGFTDFAEARRFMGALATVPVAEAYDERLGGNRRVQVRRARVVTRDGRTLEEREARRA